MNIFLYISILMLSLQLISLSHSQDLNDYPDGYWSKIEKDITVLENKIRIESQEITIKSASIDSIDSSKFPDIKVYISAYDSDGDPVPDLPSELFYMWEEHTKSGIKKLSPMIRQLKEEVSNIDIVFCIDTTGSMEDEIGLVRTNVRNFVNTLVNNKVDFRIAGISFGDEVPYRDLKPFTSDVLDFETWVSSLSAYGGDDWPENPLDCIIQASKLNYRKDAQKVIVLITDAPAHVAGDGGDSSTNATFASAKAAIDAVEGLKLYYSSPEGQYALLGSSIGWPFNGAVLVDNLGAKLVVKYVASYISPFKEKDGLKRKVVVRIGSTSTSGEYEPPLDSGSISGTVKNIDDPPKPLEGIKVTVIGEKFSQSVSTNKEGKYSFINVPVGSYKIETFHPDRVKGSKTVVVEKDKNSVVDFQLGLASVRDVKRDKLILINNLKAWKAFGGLSAPFEPIETVTEQWVNSIPDEGASDAQKEALKREILAEHAVFVSTDFVEKDAKVLSSGIVGTVWSILEALNVFDKFNKNIKSLVTKLSSYTDKWAIGTIAKKAVDWVNKLSETAMSLLKSALDFSLDLIGYMLDRAGVGGPIKDVVFGLIKDVIGLFEKGGGSSTLENIVNKVSETIGSSIVVPVYGNVVDDFLENALNKAKTITSADEPSYRSALRLWGNRIKQMQDNFEYKMKIAGYADEASKITGIIGGAVKSIKAITDHFVALGAVPVIGPILLGIAGAVDLIDRGINILKAGINAFGKAAPAGLHLYQLPDDVNKAVGAAYNLTRIQSLGISKTSVLRKYEISKQIISKLSSDSDEYTDLLDQIISYIESDDLEGLANTDLVDRLFEADKKLEISLRMMETAILAGSADDLTDKPMFDYYFNKMIETGPQNKVNRASMFVKLFIFLLYGGVNGVDVTDNKYVSMKEAILNSLYLMKGEIKDYISTLDQASSIKMYTPKVVNIISINSSVSEITQTPEDIVITAKVINPSSADLFNITVKIYVPDSFKDKIVFPEGDIKSINLAAETQEDVSFKVTYTGDIDGSRIPVYIQLSTDDSTVVTPLDKFVIINVEGSDLNENGIPDWWEEKYSINDINADDDLDGLKNYLEYRFGFNPKKKDTDDDGIWDLMEAAVENGDFVYDIDGDGKVSIKDLATILNSSRKKVFSTKYDVLPDGEINELDYVVIKSLWGSKRR